MNYKEYMEEVEERLIILSHEQKNEIIRNMARTTTEKNRTKFLDSLRNENRKFSYSSQIEDFQKWVAEIEKGTIFFECSTNEEYGMNDWDYNYDLVYHDGFRIEDRIRESLSLAEKLILQEEYKEALTIYDAFLNLRFLALDQETEESYELGFEDLMDGDIVSINYRYIAINRMYALYNLAKLDHRAEELYKVLSMPRCTNLKIEEIFSVGPKEPKAIEAFMEEWIEFLKETPGDRAGELLYEATFYKGGIEKVIGTVKSVNMIHPILFVRGCKFLMEEKRYIDALKFGLDALVSLPVHLVIRAEICNLIIPAAENERNTDVLHRLIKSAYYADSSLGHFLRLFEITEYKNIIEEAAEYAKNLPEKAPWKRGGQEYELQENSLTELEKEMILFFSGKFDDLLRQSKEDHTSLGWSSTLKGIVIPLLILIMNKEDSFTTSGEKLWDEIIYRLGYSKDNNPSLQESFILWKKKMGVSADLLEDYRDWVREEVDKRVEAMVGGGYRHSYHKAALLIVNLGEMLESRGMIKGTALTVDSYKKIYNRKRAFRAEFNEL